MGVDVHPTILIRRARAEVAAYMFDPAHDLEWTGGITASTPAHPGRLHTGSTVERRARFLGRSFTYGYVVTKEDGDRLLEMEVDKPFPMTIRYELEDGPGGTMVSIHASGDPGGFFRLATPLMGGQVRRSISGDLERLRAHLEDADV